jgi:hypothetical protein
MNRRRLVPLVVAILCLALFWWTQDGGEELPEALADSDVRDCSANLQAIYDGLRAYNERFGHAPESSGVAFFAELVSSGVWENTPSSVARLTCPGKNAHPIPEGTRFDDPSSLTSASSAYAGRNVAAHPLPGFPSGGRDVQALVACDNATGLNHDGVMNVLYSDRTVKTFTLAQLIAREVAPEGSVTIVIGPDAPLEELRALVP